MTTVTVMMILCLVESRQDCYPSQVLENYLDFDTVIIHSNTCVELYEGISHGNFQAFSSFYPKAASSPFCSIYTACVRVRERLFWPKKCRL